MENVSSEQTANKQQTCCGGGSYRCSKLDSLINELVYAANFLSSSDKKHFIKYLVAAAERTGDDCTKKTVSSLTFRTSQQR